MAKMKKDALKRTILLAAMLAVVDQLVKTLVLTYLFGAKPILGSFLQLHYVENTGMAFGIQVPQIAMITASCVIVFVMIYWMMTEKGLTKKLPSTAIALILGGGLGNLIDRIANGYVVDYIDFSFWPTFNLADIYIVAGILLLLGFYAKLAKK